MQSQSLAAMAYNNNTNGDKAPSGSGPSEPSEEAAAPGSSSKETWSELDMSNQGLRTVCPEIRFYSHLTALYLGNNKIEYLPEEFCFELRLLKVLDLTINNLAYLPASIGQLTSLERLLLQQNRIQELPVELGHLLRLKEVGTEGNPISSPPQSILQGGITTILSYLRDRMPMGPPPPERLFISYVDPPPVDKERFKVFNYNILGDAYATSGRYYYCPSWALDWNYRRQGILKEILSYDADVVCLQEVEANHFSNFFQPELSKAGYSGAFIAKSRAKTMENWGTVDGCVIFFKRSRFILVEKFTMEYQTIAIARHKEFLQDPDAFNRVITKDNVGLALILQLKADKNARVPKTRHVLISNTHIHWNPEHCDVKLIQVQIMLEQLMLLTGPKTRWHRIPMVVCGDFNSLVSSGPYDLMMSGRLKPRHLDLHPYHYGPYSTQGMQHNLGLSSAYAPIGEPSFTNFTDDFVGVLDYLWFTNETLAVSKVLQPVEEDAVRGTHLPNAYMHSDHISILSEFFFKR